MMYIDQLIEHCLTAKQAVPVNEIEIARPEEAKGIAKGIYIIEEVNGDPDVTFADFKRFKDSKQRQCGRLNSPNRVLYVGSSISGLANRLKQHVHEGHARTSALHMQHWFKGTFKITVKEYDVSREVLQIIEDAIAHELQPAFGKRGSNGR